MGRFLQFCESLICRKIRRNYKFSIAKSITFKTINEELLQV